MVLLPFYPSGAASQLKERFQAEYMTDTKMMTYADCIPLSHLF